MSRTVNRTKEPDFKAVICHTKGKKHKIEPDT